MSDYNCNMNIMVSFVQQLDHLPVRNQTVLYHNSNTILSLIKLMGNYVGKLISNQLILQKHRWRYACSVVMHTNSIHWPGLLPASHLQALPLIPCKIVFLSCDYSKTWEGHVVLPLEKRLAHRFRILVLRNIHCTCSYVSFQLNYVLSC